MSRYPVPDAEDLPELIRTAFDALPGPDEERLAAIGARLESQLAGRRKRRGNRWLWLGLLLAGGTVAAAWWVSGNLDRQEKTRVTEERPPAVERQAPSAVQERASTRGDRDTERETGIAGDDSPIIYKRETNR